MMAKRKERFVVWVYIHDSPPVAYNCEGKAEAKREYDMHVARLARFPVPGYAVMLNERGKRVDPHLGWKECP